MNSLRNEGSEGKRPVGALSGHAHQHAPIVSSLLVLVLVAHHRGEVVSRAADRRGVTERRSAQNHDRYNAAVTVVSLHSW